MKVGRLKNLRKPGFYQRCLDDITMQVNNEGDDITNTNFLSQFSYSLGSPSWYSYLQQEPEVAIIL